MHEVHVGREKRAQVRLEGSTDWLMPVSSWSCNDGFDFPADEAGYEAMLCCRIEGTPVRGHREAASVGQPESPVAVTYQAPGQRHGFSADGPVRFLHMELSSRLLGMLEDAHGGALRIRDDVIFTPDQTLFDLSKRYARTALDGRTTKLEMDAHAVLIGSHLVRNYSVDARRNRKARVSGGLAPWQLRRVVDFIEADLARDTSLAELSELVGLSTYHFCREFRRTTGLPPHRWRAQRRVESAADLLLTTDHSILEVAAAVGYEDPSRFAAAFRQVLGSSPSAYRRDR